jgi:hypothetical protein
MTTPQSATPAARTGKKAPIPGVPASHANEPSAFSVDSPKANGLFDSLEEHAAWFREPSTGSEPAKPMKGVVVQSDTLIRTAQGTHRLRRGGVLLRSEPQLLKAVQPDYFASRFVRCFSDGTEICRLSESKMDQAMALSKSNAQMRKRIHEITGVGLLKGILRCIPLSRTAKKIRTWNEEIRAHIADLALRKKLGLP